MACSIVVDLRNIYDPAEMARRGFMYIAVGRGRPQLGDAAGGPAAARAAVVNLEKIGGR
jgi:hypothetical protein